MDEHEQASDDEQLMAHVEWAGQHLELLPEGGMYWHESQALLIADPHFGKADHFRRSGIPVPWGTTADNIRRLDAMLDRTEAPRLIVLGDVFHAREGVTEGMVRLLADWRQQCVAGDRCGARQS